MGVNPPTRCYPHGRPGMSRRLTAAGPAAHSPGPPQIPSAGIAAVVVCVVLMIVVGTFYLRATSGARVAGRGRRSRVDVERDRSPAGPLPSKLPACTSRDLFRAGSCWAGSAGSTWPASLAGQCWS